MNPGQPQQSPVPQMTRSKVDVSGTYVDGTVITQEFEVEHLLGVRDFSQGLLQIMGLVKNNGGLFIKNAGNSDTLQYYPLELFKSEIKIVVRRISVSGIVA